MVSGCFESNISQYTQYFVTLSSRLGYNFEKTLLHYHEDFVTLHYYHQVCATHFY